MPIHRKLTPLLCAALALFAQPAVAERVTRDFNFDWQFHLGADADPLKDPASIAWQPVRLPHDWSIGMDFTQENTGCSTGFLPGGIGWYRKDFKLPESWKDGRVAIVFDGIYRKSQVWLNGREIGGRPSGYVSFAIDLTGLKFGDETNTLLVKADHSTYLDSRWYTGSGIYRNVRLVKTAPTHIPEWGVWVQTPEITDSSAKVTVTTEIAGPQPYQLTVGLLDPAGKTVATAKQSGTGAGTVTVPLTVPDPQRWDLATPRLYTAEIRLEHEGSPLDERSTRFGIRSSEFDAKRGYLLNGRSVKIKGVNLHHDAGAVGAAVPKDIWRERVTKLQSVGVNAIRMAHNPHSPELFELCDEMGMLVMDEFFDEWRVPKDKSLVYLSDNKAPKEAARGYSEIFDEWAERDLKATIRRDRNHPSVIMWSIGNEIEWTYPHYPKSASYTPFSAEEDYHKHPPDFDPVKIRERMAKLHSGPDELLETARQLAGWVRETDPTRPVTSGLVHPSVGYATGYAGALDVVGFNYRAWEYDGAHAMYPEVPIIGSENWGTWPEWREAVKRDFVAGIFIWTGYAYLGEAGPWPRKGLEISLFDYAGFKTPRGHFMECLWVDQPKAWLGTTAAAESEFSLGEDRQWKFTERAYDPPAMKWLRRWEWYDVAPTWNYQKDESTVVQGYSNCETVELFLNGKSLGSQTMAELDDRIAKWLVPFSSGELKLVGSNGGKPVTEDILRTHGEPAAIVLQTDRESLRPNRYDVARVELRLTDAKGVPVIAGEREITFEIDGPARLLGVDNGWEKSVQPYQTNRLTTRHGRALLLLQSTDEPGKITVRARAGDLVSEPAEFTVR